MNCKWHCTPILIILSFVLNTPLMTGQEFDLTAQQFPIDISAVANAKWCPTLANCSGFPFGTQMFNGVELQIPGSRTANNAWFAYTAAGGGSGEVSVTIPINVANVRTVYTLMNTEWGSGKPGLLTVTFMGSNGATWSYQLRGNIDVRDYADPTPYTNAIKCRLPSGRGKTGVVNAWSATHGARLDMQIFELPCSFNGQTLISMTITDSGDTNLQRSFLAATTVSTGLP